MIRTVLLDMGNVLVLFSHERMCRQVADLCGQSPAEVKQILMDSGLQWSLERGELTEEAFTERFNELSRSNVSRERLLHACSDIFTPNDGITAVLEALKAQGYRLVLLSNTCEAHVRYIREHFSVLDHFDAFATSCSVGAMKPDPRIYHRAVELAECPAAECFYTDDIAEYVTRARELGIQAEVFQSVGGLKEHLVQYGVLEPETGEN